MRSAQSQRTPGASPLALDLGRRGVGEPSLAGGWRNWAAWAVAAAIVASAVSIAASSVLLGAAAAIWLSAVVRDRRLHLSPPPFAWPLAGFSAAVALAIACSIDPVHSLYYLLKAVKLLLVVLVWSLLSRRRIETVFKAVYIALGLSAVYGILQYFWLLDINLLNRIRGFMSHWMTFSGQMMMGVVSLSCFLAWSLSARPPGRGRKPEPGILWWLILAAMGTALLLTFTRNAWLGAGVGLTVALLLFNRRLILPAMAAVAVLLVVLPTAFQDRLLDGFDPRDTTTRTRLELLRTGAAMVADHPLTGVGPGMVPVASPRYRGDTEFPGWLYQHLHNSPLQVAAETGLVGLGAWLVLWGVLLRDFLRMERAGRVRRGFAHFAAANAICVTAGFLAAGLLEYNFGDSELLNLMIFFIVAPYVLTQRDTTSA